MTSAGIVVESAGEGFMQLFYRVAPDLGTNTVQVTTTGDDSWSIVGGSVSFNGVSQTTPISNVATNIGTSATPNVNVTSAAGNMVVDVVGAGDDVNTSTNVLRWNNDLNTDTAAGAQSTASGASSVTMQYSLAGSARWGMVAMNINAAGGPSVIVKPPNNLGLIAYWPMNEATTTRVGDFSGNGNTGTFDDWSGIGTLPTWTNGKRGAAISFVSDDYIALANSTTLDPGTATYAVSAWFYANSPCGGGSECFIYNDYGTSDIGAVNLYIGTTGNLNGDFRDNSGNECNGSTNPTPVSNNQWHHVVWVRDSQTTCKLYLDGIIEATDTDASLGTITVSTGDIPTIGALNGGAESPFTGRIDDVRIYKNRVITEADVVKLYAGGTSGAARANASSAVLSGNTPLGPAGGLVAHWTFDGADVAGVVYDRAGTNHGYLFNSATSSAKRIGKLGQALNFDLATDWVNVGTSNTLEPPNLTVALWVKRTNASTWGIDGTFFNTKSGGWTGNGWYFGEAEWINLVVDGDKWEGACAAGGINQMYPLNEWVHVAATFDTVANDIRLYRNGIEQTTTQGFGTPDTITPTGNTKYLGWASPEMGFTEQGGDIDDVRIYSRVLSPAEIEQLHKLGTVRVTQ